MKLVVLDLDGTLSYDNVSFAFSKFLYKRGVLSPLKMCNLIIFSLLFRFGLIAVERVHKIGFRYILKGKTVEEIASQVSLFLPECRFRLELLDLPHDDMWLLSSSPDCIVEPIAASLGIKTTLATSYIIEEGRYVDIAQIVTGDVKAQFLKSSGCKRENIVAYSDSIHDLTVLELAGSAVAVAPDSKLRALAIARGWPILE